MLEERKKMVDQDIQQFEEFEGTEFYVYPDHLYHVKEQVEQAMVAAKEEFYRVEEQLQEMFTTKERLQALLERFHSDIVHQTQAKIRDLSFMQEVMVKN